MVLGCVTCGVKKPPLAPLSDENLQLLDVIVAPFVDMMDFTGYQLLICVNCKLLIKWILNFQKTARRSLRSFKTLMSEEESQPVVEPLTLVKHIEEIKQEPVTIKTETEDDFSNTNQQHFSVPASDDKETIELELELVPEPKTELNYDSESTISADEIPDPISHQDPDPISHQDPDPISHPDPYLISHPDPDPKSHPDLDPLLARRGSVGSAAPSSAKQTPGKTVTTVNPLPAPKLAQLPKNKRRKRTVLPKTAENAENNIPGFIQVLEQSLR